MDTKHYEEAKQLVKEAAAVNPDVNEMLMKHIEKLENEVEQCKQYKAEINDVAEDLENESAEHINKIEKLEAELAEEKEISNYWRNRAVQLVHVGKTNNALKELAEEQAGIITGLKQALGVLLK